MKTLKKMSLLVLGFFGLFLLVFGWPIYNPSESKSIMIDGTFGSFHLNEQNKDIQITLLNDDGRYYINRGMELGVNASSLESIKNKNVSVWYAKHWSLLNYNKKYRHVTQIQIDDKIVFSEFE